MTKVITITNQKGGSSKTSTSLFLSYGLALREYKVLFVDLDSQADASFSTGVNFNESKSSLEVILNEIDINDAIISLPTNNKANIDLLPASGNLTSLDIQLVKRQIIDAQFNLSDAITHLKKEYDFIIIDTPPAIGMASLNALTASDYVVVPTQADIYGLKGLGKLASTISSIKRRSNPKLQTLGIVLGRYDSRTNFTKAVTQMLNDTCKKLQTKVFTTKIREAIVVKEAQGERINLFEYAPKAKVTNDVNNFIDEFLEGVQNDK